jgi:hypothetical protein
VPLLIPCQQQAANSDDKRYMPQRKRRETRRHPHTNKQHTAETRETLSSNTCFCGSQNGFMGSKCGGQCPKAIGIVARDGYLKVSTAICAPRRRMLLWGWLGLSNVDFWVPNCCWSFMVNSNCSVQCPEAVSHLLLSPYQIIDKSLRTLSSGKELRGGSPVPSHVLEPACMWIDWLSTSSAEQRTFPKQSIMSKEAFQHDNGVRTRHIHSGCISTSQNRRENPGKSLDDLLLMLTRFRIKKNIGKRTQSVAP